MATEPRACRAEELPALVDLANRVFRGERSGDMAAEYPLVFDAENLEGMRIIPGTSGPVGHVGVCIREARVLGARFRVASIGAVCTDPGHRGGGLASALMEDARRYALGHGASLMLISGGRGLYHRLGYVTIGRFHRYRLDAERLHGLRVPGVEVAGHRPEELPQIAALYQLEPIRFVRPAEDWERLLRAGMLMNAAADLLTVLQASWSLTSGSSGLRVMVARRSESSGYRSSREPGRRSSQRCPACWSDTAPAALA
jgi:predicted N-acetyltransferase YhbS